MANPFVHIELQTKDLAKAKEFYTKLFDWKLQDIISPSGTYTMIDVGDGTGGGMFQNPDPQAVPRWLAYVAVDDIVAATDKARELGATVVQEVMEINSYGWFSIIIDPTGATIAMWKAKTT
jgi:predicted enzyme related to lactoylglutathione lyase